MSSVLMLNAPIDKIHGYHKEPHMDIKGACVSTKRFQRPK
jgi:hypothetical protein